MFKIIGWLLGSVVLLYALVFAVFYLFQDKFVFQTKSLPVEYAFNFNQEFEEFFIPTGKSDTLNALFFRAKREPAGLILYFHGNANNLQRWGEYAVDFTSLGYDVLMIDYRGYGKSTGTPSEENLYEDAQTILQWSTDTFDYKKLILYGRSLGSAVASHLAITANADLLILETPFEELEDVLYFFSSQYKFSNKTFLPKISCSRVIIQGTHDGVVPLSSALKLKPLLDADDRFVIIAGGNHHNLREFDEYHITLREVLK